MVEYWYIDRDVTQNRGPRLGASDIAACVPNPEKPNESLAGYGRTAVTVFQEKKKMIPRTPPGLPAEMGHTLEPKAVELFLRGIFGYDFAAEYYFRRMQYEILRRMKQKVKARDYQTPPIFHNIEYFTDDFIVHPDGIFSPDQSGQIKYEVLDSNEIVTAHGLAIDLSKPFLIEAKSAQHYSAKRPEGSMVTGYDFDLKTWQGIPLKNYVQIQFQLAIMEAEICYLPLIHDTSQFQVWEIRPDRKIQNQLIDIAAKMAWYIRNNKPPKELAMNAKDIQALYPEVKNDFTYLSEEETNAAREASVAYHKAAKQEKIWGAKKKEAQDTLAVHLKDYKEIRDKEGVICRWTERKGSDRIKALGKIEKENPVEYRYLRRKKLIEQGEPTRYPSAVFKGEE